jgi:hypothetical protein
MVDGNGHLCLTPNGALAAEVSGPALRAGPAEVEILVGIGPFVVCSTGKPGRIRMTWSGENLRGATGAGVAQ